MSGISVYRLGAAALIAILLLASPLAFAASSPTASETEQSSIGFFSFVMSLFSEAWESEAQESEAREREIEPQSGESGEDPGRPLPGDPTRQQGGEQQESESGCQMDPDGCS